MMRIIQIIRHVLNPTPYDEYFDRFIMPQYRRGQEAGIAESYLELYVSRAFDCADEIRLPAMILRDLIDQHIEGGLPLDRGGEA